MPVRRIVTRIALLSVTVALLAPLTASAEKTEDPPAWYRSNEGSTTAIQLQTRGGPPGPEFLFEETRIWDTGEIKIQKLHFRAALASIWPRNPYVNVTHTFHVKREQVATLFTALSGIEFTKLSQDAIVKRWADRDTVRLTLVRDGQPAGTAVFLDRLPPELTAFGAAVDALEALGLTDGK